MTINLKVFGNLQAIILTLIIAVIFIVLASAYINGQAVANDRKRIADMEQIQTALKTYFDENGFYPASVDGKPKDIETYLSFWPQAPSADGSCTAEQNNYTYSKRPGFDYWVDFCLGGNYKAFSAGVHRASSRGIE